MTDRLTRWLAAALLALGRRLPEHRREWAEAVVAESAHTPPGRRRIAWLLGAVPVLSVEVIAGYAFRAWPVRVAVISAVAAVAVLAFVVVDRYPQVGQGAGTPLYVGLTVLLLSAYVVATYTLTRVDRVAATWGLVAGVLGAALLTLGMPAGGTYHVSGPLLLVYGAGLVAAFAGPPAVVAALVTRRDRSVQRGILAGAATGMYAALANLVGVLVLVMALPGRVPMDSDVLARHHTAADILGANVGEDLAVYIALLLGWPVVAVVLAMAASSLASLRTPPRAAGSSAHSGTR